MKFIANSTHILSIFLTSILMVHATPSHAQFINKKWGKNTMIAPNKKEIEVSWAVSEKEKRQGLSGLKSHAMKKDQGLLFVYRRMMPLKFWMPNTFFDLDIIFLDKNFKVVAIETLPHYPKKDNPKKIPITNPHLSQFVLELHAGMAKKYKIVKGSQLKWKKALSQKFLNSLGIE